MRRLSVVVAAGLCWSVVRVPRPARQSLLSPAAASRRRWRGGGGASQTTPTTTSTATHGATSSHGLPQRRRRIETAASLRHVHSTLMRLLLLLTTVTSVVTLYRQWCGLWVDGWCRCRSKCGRRRAMGDTCGVTAGTDTEQVSVEPRTSALNMTLPTTAARAPAAVDPWPVRATGSCLLPAPRLRQAADVDRRKDRRMDGWTVAQTFTLHRMLYAGGVKKCLLKLCYG